MTVDELKGGMGLIFERLKVAFRTPGQPTCMPQGVDEAWVKLMTCTEVELCERYDLMLSKSVNNARNFMGRAGGMRGGWADDRTDGWTGDGRKREGQADGWPRGRADGCAFHCVRSELLRNRLQILVTNCKYLQLFATR